MFFLHSLPNLVYTNAFACCIIDNIFFNSLEHFVISGNLCYDLTDHLPNFLIVSKLSSLPASTKVFRRDYSNFDKERLISDIQSIDWNSLLKKAPDPSSMFDNCGPKRGTQP